MNQSSEDKRLFLLDAYALIFRGYYAFIKSPRINSKGMNTSAIMGFMNSLLDLIKKEQPTHLAVVFDVSNVATVRHEYFPEYKANRDETPDPIRQSIPIIQDILKAMHIPVLFSGGYEADDVIGTLSIKAEKAGYTTFMMTPDKDFAQLVTENVKVFKPSSRGNGLEIWGIEQVKEKFGVDHPNQIIDYLGMMGDSVDNIPGIPGIGPKTASKFLKKYGSMEGLYENVDDLKGKQKENVVNFKEQAFLSKKLATIITDVPIEFKEENLTVDQPDLEKIKEIFAELEFRRLLENIYRTYGREAEMTTENPHATDGQQIGMFDTEENAVEVAPSTQRNIETEDHFYQLVDSDMGRKILVQNLLKQKEICIDCETTSLKSLQAELVGISFTYEAGKGYYVNMPTDFDECKAIIKEFKEVLESDSILKIGQNIKYDIKVLFKYGIQLSAPIYDTMVAHYLINPDMRHNLNVLSETYLNYKPVSIESLIGKKGKNQKNFRDVPLKDQKEYGVEDTDITYRLYKAFEPKIKEVGAASLLYDIELPLVQTLAKMEEVGIALDVDALAKLSKELEIDLKELEEAIFAESGQPFNINSPKQLGEILFDVLKISDNAKKTRTGQYSTGEDILVTYSEDHKIVRDVLNYRQLQKLKSTYVDALPQEVDPKTGRIHTVFAQTVAATGRLASNNPNLQNIPIRTERGQEVRKAFIPKDEDHVIIAADYSQIELRLIAVMSGDQVMLEAFKNDEDIHTATAAKVFNVPADEVTREQRSNAKTVNFGIIYGVSSFGLSKQTGLSRKESKDLIDAYLETYPQLNKYMKEQVKLAKKQGYVETILGRRRYLEGINSSNHTVRGHAERNAVNAPVQGSAADIIKLAMVKMDKVFLENNFKTRMLLQVHDELVFDAPKEEVEKVVPIIQETMENILDLEVSLKVECGVGNNWLEAH